MSSSARLLIAAVLSFGIVATSAIGCDSDGEEPATTCKYNYGDSEVENDFGKACEENADCAHGVCMMPGDDGNITNAVFGFCTRGCDCGNSEDAQVSSSDYHCVYPGNCFIGESQGAWRYVAPQCSSVDECTAIDARYTDCATTDSMTVAAKTCGSLRKVCQAHSN